MPRVTELENDRSRVQTQQSGSRGRFQGTNKETERNRARLRRGGAGAVSRFPGIKVMGEGTQARVDTKSWQDEQLVLFKNVGGCVQRVLDGGWSRSRRRG